MGGDKLERRDGNRHNKQCAEAERRRRSLQVECWETHRGPTVSANKSHRPPWYLIHTSTHSLFLLHRLIADRLIPLLQASRSSGGANGSRCPTSGWSLKNSRIHAASTSLTFPVSRCRCRGRLMKTTTESGNKRQMNGSARSWTSSFRSTQASHR